MSPEPSESPADPPRVFLEDVVKTYGDFKAVDGIDLEAPPGEVFGILGPNGAGKTTTMRMLSGMLQPTAGRLVVDGHPLATEKRAAKRVTGFIPDSPYVYDKLTGFEYLRFVAGLYDVASDSAASRIDDLLGQFDLREWGDRLIESYSHGMKQRLVFAGALLPKPKVLVIDEPMVGLDPKGHQLVKRLFRDLAHDRGLTVLLSTHTLEVAEEVCDRLVILDHGRIVARGTLEELRLEAGETEGSLEEVFLTLTEQTDEERARAVAERFGENGGGE